MKRINNHNNNNKKVTVIIFMLCLRFTCVFVLYNNRVLGYVQLNRIIHTYVPTCINLYLGSYTKTDIYNGQRK